MKYKYFPAPFFTPAITKSKSLHGVLRVNFPHKNGPIPLWLAPDLITSKSNHSPPPIYALPSPTNMTTKNSNDRQNTKFPPNARFPSQT